MGDLLLIFTVYCTLRDLVTPFNLLVVFLARAFFHWRKRKRCKWIIIALVKYLDIYGRGFGINIRFKRPSVYDRTRGDHTAQYTVWHCTINIFTFTSDILFLIVYQNSYGMAGRRGYVTIHGMGVLVLNLSDRASANNRESLHDEYRELSCHVAG
jgi:hypothetical protein